MSGMQRSVWARVPDIGARVHAIRQKDSELTLGQIAQRLGYTPAHISQVYNKWLRQQGLEVVDKRLKAVRTVTFSHGAR